MYSILSYISPFALFVSPLARILDKDVKAFNGATKLGSQFLAPRDHFGFEVNVFVNTTPSRATRSKFGVFTHGTPKYDV